MYVHTVLSNVKLTLLLPLQLNLTHLTAKMQDCLAMRMADYVQVNKPRVFMPSNAHTVRVVISTPTHTVPYCIISIHEVGTKQDECKSSVHAFNMHTVGSSHLSQYVYNTYVRIQWNLVNWTMV